jgi:hypothetical protein
MVRTKVRPVSPSDLRNSRIDWVRESSVTNTPGQAVSMSSSFEITGPLLRAKWTSTACALGRRWVCVPFLFSSPLSTSSVKPEKRMISVAAPGCIGRPTGGDIDNQNVKHSG